jgi:hypothetical protein
MARGAFELSDAEAHELALELEQRVRASLERFFGEHHPVNQGNNGIIFQVIEDDMDPADAKTLREVGYLKGNESAAKVLKIYNPGEGMREFQMQKRSYDALERARTAEPEKPFALIPQPLGIGDYELAADVAESLNAKGAKLHSNKAEALFMEFLHAKDFARIVYEEVIARTDPRKLEPYGKSPNETMEEFAHGNRSMEDLWLLVSRMLNLENPETKAADGTIAVDQKILFRNSGKIFSFLAAAGYKVHPRMAEQLANTVAVIHELPVRHNDIHERNLMVVGDPQTEDAQLYLIDFGAASDKKPALDTFRDDESLIGILQRMQETKSDVQERERQSEYRNEVDAIEKRLMTPGAAMAHDRLLPLITAGDAYLGEYLCGEGAIMNTYDRLAGLKLLVDEGALTSAEADACIEQALAYIARKKEELNKRRRTKPEYLPFHKGVFQKCRGIFSTAWRS